LIAYTRVLNGPFKDQILIMCDLYKGYLL